MGDPSVDRLTIEGPLNPTGPARRHRARRSSSARPPRRSRTSCRARARSSAALLRRAYRRPVTDSDLETLLSFYQRAAERARHLRGRHRIARCSSSWRARSSCSASSPIPPMLAVGAAYRLGDLALASRLSFFLWSSIPDDELLELGEPGKAARARRARAAGDAHAGRPAADALVDNFAEQWLFLRNLKSSVARSADLPRLRRQPAPGDAARRPSCSSRASCARTAACWIC